MSSMIIPKEQQTAYERWELSALAGSSHKIQPVREKKSSELSETLAQITDVARQQGYQQGYEQGSQQARLEMGVDAQALASIAEAMHKIVDINQQQIAQDLLNLALDIAKSMLKSRLEVNRDVIIPIVEEAIQSLPSVQKPAKIIVNPSDAAMVKQALAETINGTSNNLWQLVENSDIERGGCLIETGANHVDATNTTRWKRINEALGCKTDWMMHD